MKRKYNRLLCYFFLLNLFTLVIPAFLLSEEFYSFERLWPTLRQPWYFNNPSDVDIDEDGYVYITDKWNYCLHKLTRDGLFVTRWGTKGSKEGEFLKPYGIAVYRSDVVYVSDGENHCIQKFDTNGKFLGRWGKNGSEQGEFDEPYGIAVDDMGFVYVADRQNNRIQKFTAEGQFIVEWGSKGSGIGEFDLPHGITVDKNNIVYVADEENHCIQVFEPNHNNDDYSFVTKIGSKGSNNLQFNEPYDVEVDNNGYIYVAEKKNCRIQKIKFSYPQNGDKSYSFSLKWGKKGNGKGEFGIIHAIGVDPNGFLFVANGWDDLEDSWDLNDISNPLISEDQITSLVWFDRWTEAINKLSEVWSNDIQKFTLSGNFLAKWSNYGSDEMFFQGASSIDKDNNGYIYVSDSQNHRIQIFDENGKYIGKYGVEGKNEGEFKYPISISIDKNNYIYVFDTMHRIQKFRIKDNFDFEFVTKWGNEGDGPGEFKMPVFITVSKDGKSVFVADSGNHRIQKFTKSNGDDYIFSTEWGEETLYQFIEINGHFIKIHTTPIDGKFAYPSGIGVDSNGFVYVVETALHRLQVFKPIDDSYEFYLSIGGLGKKQGEFYYPVGLEIDHNDNVYIADTWNHRIQKGKKEDGEIVISTFGEFGSNPGQLNLPADSCVSENGNNIFVSDANHRIQLFERKIIPEGITKAIIVAGGGPYQGNDLWPSISMNATFAYHSLIYQGISSDNIYYLSHNKDLNLDFNGLNDDIDDYANLSSFESSIKEWAKNADNLIIYLVDHGGINDNQVGVFRMNESEILLSSDLDLWLDAFQQNNSKQVLMIYDACKSGSFISSLVPSGEQRRIIITSTSSDEGAKFIMQGSISFSYYFWGHIYNGASISDSFLMASQSIEKYQTPLLDANGNTLANESVDYSIVQDMYIGNAIQISEEMPIIHSVSEDQTISNTSIAQIQAYSVYDKDGIERVWAIIKPPNYVLKSTLNPVRELPYVELNRINNNFFETSYDKFNITGNYEVSIFARDRFGNTSLPKTTNVTVNNSLRHKAILITGGPRNANIWGAIEKNIKLAFEALVFQGYLPEDIKIMKPPGSSIPYIPVSQEESSLSTIKARIDTWGANNTEDLLLYFVGNGDSEIFTINANEVLQAQILNNWVNQYQQNTGKQIIIIFDSKNSGSFIPLLVPDSNDNNRIVLSSTGVLQPAYFLSNGDISFSSFFWKRILNGASLYKAFVYAKKSMEFSCVIQVSQIDDNCNGVGNEISDGIISNDYHIGAGIILGDDTPVIGIVDSKTISGNESLVFVKDVTSTGVIKQVYAVIIPPCFLNWKHDQANLPKVDLVWKQNKKQYEIVYSFDVLGEYRIKVYAVDNNNNVSMPLETIVNCVAGNLDQYENDDTWETANVIPINDQNQTNQEIPGYDWNQLHNFHSYGDQDWVKFYGSEKETYKITAEFKGEHCSANIQLYVWNTDGKSVAFLKESIDKGKESMIEFDAPISGIYFAKINNSNPSIFGNNTEYQLNLTSTNATFNGFLYGTVAPKEAKATIKTNGINGNDALTLPNGTFFMPHIAGSFTLTADAIGYSIQKKQIIIKELSLTSVDIKLLPLNNHTDMDNDGMPDEWEHKHNLNPYFNDAQDDLDEDGLNNLEEFLTGSSPDNIRPEKPVLSSPINGYTNTSLTPELYTEEFSDIDTNDSHEATQWQISRSPFISDSGINENLVFDQKTSSFLTSLIVPDYILSSNTKYYWRVKFFGNHGYSEWSDSQFFNTNNDNINDTNNNGIPDNQEIDNSLDIDNNDVPDIKQTDMKCANTLSENFYICVKKSENVITIDNLRSIDPYRYTFGIPTRLETLPLGLISFRLTVEKGEDAEVIIYLSEYPNGNSKWFLYDIQNNWQDFSKHSEINKEMVILRLKDGDIGDTDGVENSVIVNLTGLAVGNDNPPLSGTGDCSVGECFIKTLLNRINE